METQVDPVIAEVRAIRDESNYNVGAISGGFARCRMSPGREYVSYPARRIVEGSDEPLAV